MPWRPPEGRRLCISKHEKPALGSLSHQDHIYQWPDGTAWQVGKWFCQAVLRPQGHRWKGGWALLLLLLSTVRRANHSLGEHILEYGTSPVPGLSLSSTPAMDRSAVLGTGMAALTAGMDLGS